MTGLVWNEVEAYRNLHYDEGDKALVNVEAADRFYPYDANQSERDHPSRPWNDVLEVSAAASFTEIKAAFRRKIAQYHPDRVAGLGSELQDLAEKHSIVINRAYSEARKMHGRT